MSKQITPSAFESLAKEQLLYPQEQLAMLEKDNQEMPLTSSRCPSGKHRLNCLRSVTQVYSINPCRHQRVNWLLSDGSMRSTRHIRFTDRAKSLRFYILK